MYWRLTSKSVICSGNIRQAQTFISIYHQTSATIWYEVRTFLWYFSAISLDKFQYSSAYFGDHMIWSKNLSTVKGVQKSWWARTRILKSLTCQKKFLTPPHPPCDRLLTSQNSRSPRIQNSLAWPIKGICWKWGYVYSLGSYKKPTFGTFLHKTFLKLSYKNFLKISGVWN